MGEFYVWDERCKALLNLIKQEPNEIYYFQVKMCSRKTSYVVDLEAM